MCADDMKSITLSTIKCNIKVNYKENTKEKW